MSKLALGSLVFKLPRHQWCDGDAAALSRVKQMEGAAAIEKLHNSSIVINQ